MNNEQWTMNNEQWTMNNEQWTMNNEQWTINTVNNKDNNAKTKFDIVTMTKQNITYLQCDKTMLFTILFAL